MTNMEYQNAFSEALKKRYDSIPNPEDLSYDYEFSPRFEHRMKRMVKNFDRIRSEAQKEVGRHEIITTSGYGFRRVAVIALVTALIMALAACAVHFALIWHERNNENHGTLDVSFEIQNPAYATDAFAFKEPTVPDNFVRKVIYQENSVQNIEYKDVESEIVFYYNQTVVTESMSLSIDNEAESFESIEINGHKGYSVDEPEYSAVTWSDGVSLYTILSNASLQKLIPIAESID